MNIAIINKMATLANHLHINGLNDQANSLDYYVYAALRDLNVTSEVEADIRKNLEGKLDDLMDSLKAAITERSKAGFKLINKGESEEKKEQHLESYREGYNQTVRHIAKLHNLLLKKMEQAVGKAFQTASFPSIKEDTEKEGFVVAIDVPKRRVVPVKTKQEAAKIWLESVGPVIKLVVTDILNNLGMAKLVGDFKKVIELYLGNTDTRFFGEHGVGAELGNAMPNILKETFGPKSIAKLLVDHFRNNVAKAASVKTVIKVASVQELAKESRLCLTRVAEDADRLGFDIIAERADRLMI